MSDIEAAARAVIEAWDSPESHDPDAAVEVLRSALDAPTAGGGESDSPVALDIETTCPKCHEPYAQHTGDEATTVCPNILKKMETVPSWLPVSLHQGRREVSDDIERAYGAAFGVGPMPTNSREWFALGYRAALAKNAGNTPPTATGEAPPCGCDIDATRHDRSCPAYTGNAAPTPPPATGEDIAERNRRWEFDAVKRALDTGEEPHAIRGYHDKYLNEYALTLRRVAAAARNEKKWLAAEREADPRRGEDGAAIDVPYDPAPRLPPDPSAAFSSGKFTIVDDEFRKAVADWCAATYGSLGKREADMVWLAWVKATDVAYNRVAGVSPHPDPRGEDGAAIDAQDPMAEYVAASLAWWLDESPEAERLEGETWERFHRAYYRLPVSVRMGR